jgi:hypothetical protein
MSKYSDVVVHKDKRGIKPWRTALIGDELDAEPVIPVSVLIIKRLWVEVGRRDCVDHFLDVHATNAGEHSPTTRGAADATPVDPMASPSTTAEMAILALPMLFPRARLWRSDGCPPDEAASFSPSNLPVSSSSQPMAKL